MRLDKYLKVTRIIKRRTISKEIINFGQVKVNNKIAKPSTNLKVNDIISLQMGDKKMVFEVCSLDEKLAKNNITDMYKIIN